MEFEKPYQYGSSVKISKWQDRMQQFPVDHVNAERTGQSHYRTFGESDTVFIPKTTTQDQLESGVKAKAIFRQVAKSQINFMSYPMNDFRFNSYQHQDESVEPITTTYREIYKAPKALIVKPDCCETVADPLLNRIPKNDFDMRPSSENKFMDDHLVKLSESRKKTNFLRQIRNSTYIFD